MAATKQDLAKLRDPLPPRAIEWRAQSTGDKNGKPWIRVLAYVTNRAIMERLDEVVGPDAWKNEYTPGPSGGVACGLSILVDHGPGGAEWITRWDGAENTDVEGVKGGLSGAMKRAAVQWGIGRYLYELDEGWGVVSPSGQFSAKAKDGSWFKWDPPALPAWALPGGSGHPDADRPRAVSAPDPAPSPMPPRPTPERAAAVLALPEPYGPAFETIGEFAPVVQAIPVSEPVCPKCNGRMWDNRGTPDKPKLNPKAPDYKCRDRTCDGVIWPPRPVAAQGGLDLTGGRSNGAPSPQSVGR